MLNLRPLRERAGLSQNATARAMGVSHASYFAWEAGRSLPSADKLPKLAALFSCSIDELYIHDHILPREGGN